MRVAVCERALEARELVRLARSRLGEECVDLLEKAGHALVGHSPPIIKRPERGHKGHEAHRLGPYGPGLTPVRVLRTMMGRATPFPDSRPRRARPCLHCGRAGNTAREAARTRTRRTARLAGADRCPRVRPPDRRDALLRARVALTGACFEREARSHVCSARRTRPGV